MPTGCHEQTFNSWIPNTVGMKYLKSVGQLTKDYEARGITYLQKGYQHILTLSTDGSYKMFYGDQTKKNTWMTAYIVKLLAFAKEFYPINDKVLSQALEYLKTQQILSGTFTDHSPYIHFKYNSESHRGIPHTAFVAISYMETGQNYIVTYSDVIQKALKYIHTQVAKFDDNYKIAIAAYALALNDTNGANELIKSLKEKAVKHDDFMYWHTNNKTQLDINWKPSSIDIETAAYAILAFAKAGKAEDAVPIMNWMLSHRNKLGGSFTTTDTVIAVQALSVMAKKFHKRSTNVGVKMEYENGRKKVFTIDNSNALELQTYEMEPDTRSVNCKLIGTGIAYVQLSWQYNVKADPYSQFNINVNVIPTSKNFLHLKICASFIPNNDRSSASMTLMEINLPSGYVYDPATVGLAGPSGVKVKLQS